MNRSYEITTEPLTELASLIERHHGYGSCGKSATYGFGVRESGLLVAAYVWSPPPFGAAKAVCPELPWAVLALSRMVAVPRSERQLNHVSKPLRYQMRALIDRTRWPALITYSDEGQGHTGHVYKCSGWRKTARNKRPYFVDSQGNRASSYSNGKHGSRELQRGGHTWLQRWEQWGCASSDVVEHVTQAGWCREAIPGRTWASGNQAHRIVKCTTPEK